MVRGPNRVHVSISIRVSINTRMHSFHEPFTRRDPREIVPFKTKKKTDDRDMLDSSVLFYMSSRDEKGHELNQ